MNTFNNDSVRQGTTGRDMAQPDGTDHDQNHAGITNRTGFDDDANQQANHNTTGDDLSRKDATGHDTARNSVTGRDVSRQGATERDDMDAIATGSVGGQDSAINAENPDTDETPEWIEIDQTVQMLKRQGIRRTVRSIQRFCKKGKLVCQLIPADNGVRYLINSASIDAFVERHNWTMPSRGFGTFSEDGAGDIASRSGLTDQHAARIEQNDQHSQTVLALKDQQIDMLKSQLAVTNKQLDMKDEQISAMLERDHETNVLIQNLQNLVALPASSSPLDRDQGSSIPPTANAIEQVEADSSI